MEQKETSTKPNNSLDESNSERNTTRGDEPEIRTSLRSSTVIKTASKIYTNQEFLEEKLANCKNYICSIDYLKETSLSKAFLSLTAKEVLEWVIWMKNEGKKIETGISELFALHKLSVDKLKPEEFEKIKLYFTCFQTLATKTY